MLAFFVTVICATSLTAQDAQVPGNWTVVPSPNGGSQAGGNVLLATAALSSTDAWAVGAEPNPNQYLTATLAEHWDGTQWSIFPTPTISEPTVQLNSIAAVNNSDIWAAGDSDNPSCLCGQTVVERWNGRSWTRVASPNPGVADYLTGIATISATDIWAVGYEWISQSTWVPLLLHYNGTSWKPFSKVQLQFGLLSSVYARTTNDVWAVGWIGTGGNIQGLALHWNGRSWKRVSFPPDTGILLKSVSGVTTRDVWTVGNFSENGSSSAVSYHWDGSRWSAVTVGLGGYSYLASVASVAGDDVWAVGEGIVFPNQNESYVTYHWDGKGWSNVSNPDQGVPYGVSASSSSDAWAVGAGFVTLGTYTMHFHPAVGATHKFFTWAFDDSRIYNLITYR
jgi:hypothetical protein